MGINEAAAKGQGKLNRKASSMTASYGASLGRATANFRAFGFGPTRTRNYEEGVRAGQANYGPGVAAGIGKWTANWVSKMSE